MFSIDGLDEAIYSDDLASFAEHYAHLFVDAKFVQSSITLGELKFKYGSQPLSGAILEYASLLEESLLGKPHDLTIDGLNVAEITYNNEFTLIRSTCLYRSTSTSARLSTSEFQRDLVRCIKLLCYGQWVLDMRKSLQFRGHDT